MLKLITIAFIGVALSGPFAHSVETRIEDSFFCKAKPEDEPYYVEVDAEKTCGPGREVVRTFFGVCHQRVQCAFISEAAKKLIVELALEDVFNTEFQKTAASAPELFKDFKEKQLSNVPIAYGRLTAFQKERALAKAQASDIDWQRGVVTCRAVKVNDAPKCPPPDVCKNDQDFKSRNTATIRAAELDSAMVKMIEKSGKTQPPATTPSSSPSSQQSPGQAAKGTH